IISALAFDQRGALKRMMAAHQDTEPAPWQIEALKALVSEELTPYASSILLDPEYGLPATKVRDEKSGLLLAYEQTGYDTTTTSRLPDCLVDWSVKRLKEAGADAVKFLLYYDVDGDEYINQQKQAYIERIGSECQVEEIPFFLEVLTYDEAITDNQSVAFAKLKAHKVNEAMKVFSAERFGVDVLKVEVPVNMAYVEGFAEGEVVYSKEEAMQAFRDQEAASHLPYIYLSAGVSASLFQETLVFAAEAGARFNGVLCGRATWSGAVAVYMSEGEAAARQWLRTEGFQNIDRLNQVLEKTASPWTTKLTLDEA
ncbi:TPA: tagatose-bisphosphate aldolase, partial [Streptococcus equi subsp. zooepidemicus]|nr:tagatose-bisphosphate aldolase [Streptococcus equi subsp. zooepidemicus]HEL0207647.1 tagatose-bisphosphate aldolase [Streptococcus equi subsp. zooepidemicus]HEL0533253.1 tagatose-bisphosphate aldolase [Streptococcus equi subsp. zooepidemicus]HEL1288087.1 tagatose-bisphosphate aldolase [Streptococcus equi subsp. zooepidemicus]